MIIYDSNKKASVSQIGHKANQLTNLAAHGFNVPDWFVLGADCFNDFILDHRTEFNKSLDHYDEKNRQNIVKIIKETEFTKETKRKIEHELTKRFRPKDVLAIRSSATEENMPCANFIFVRQNQELFERIKECYLACFSKEAMAERAKRQTINRNISMPIIIQKMVDADFSGTIFTTNPLNNNPDEILIETTLGINKESTSNVVVGNNSEIRTDTSKLTVRINDEILHRLVRIGKGIEKSFKPQYAQEISFAVKNNHIFILQSQPIAAYHTIDKSLPHIILENTKIAEYCHGITTPLTYSFLRDLFREVQLNTLAYFGASEEDIEYAKRNNRNCFYFYENRTYYRPDVLNKNLSLFSNNQKIRTYLTGQIARSKRSTKKFIEKFDRITRPYHNNFFNGYTNGQLIDIFSEIEQELLENFTVLAASDINTNIAYNALMNQAERAGIHQPENLLSEILIPSTNIKSVEASRDFIALIKGIKREPSLVQLFQNTATSVLTNNLRTNPLIIYSKISNYITKYDPFIIDSFKFEATTLSDDPSFIINNIKKYLQCEKLPILQPKTTSPQLFYRHFHRIQKNNAKYLLRTADYFINNRESLYQRLLSTYAIVRNIYRRIGRNLASENILRYSSDIFFLEENEVIAIVKNGKYTTEEIQEMVSARKKEYFANLKRPDHERLFFYGHILPENALSIQEPTGEILSGLGGSDSLTIGKAKRVNHPQEIKLSDEIILADCINPTWNITLPFIKAIAVKHGSALDHAILAVRALDISSVFGIKNLSQIKNNDIIKVDGRNGTVELIEQTIE